MKKYIPQLFLIVVICYILALIYPAISGKLSGTFQAHSVPKEYTTLENFLIDQKEFSRTLWVPTTQRFGFYSINHPEMNAEELFHTSNITGVLTVLHKPETESFLEDLSVTYIVIPYDSERELFLKNNIYNSMLYKTTVSQIGKIYWLKEIHGFGRIHVFKILSSKDHFWISGSGSMQEKLSYSSISPTLYRISLTNVIKGDRIIFAESYDNYWIARVQTSGNEEIKSSPYMGLLNSFVIPKNGSYMLYVSYAAQTWASIGYLVSALTFILVLILFVTLHKRRLK